MIAPPARKGGARIRSESRAWAGDVEGGGGFVQEPDRPRRRQQAGNGEPAALAGRQIAGRQAGKVARPTAARAPARKVAPSPPAQIGGPEIQVLGDRQRRLQGIAVAQIVGLFGEAELRVATVEVDLAGRSREQPRDQAQQRRLAGAVATREDERLTARDGENRGRRTPRGPPRTQLSRWPVTRIP